MRPHGAWFSLLVRLTLASIAAASIVGTAPALGEDGADVGPQVWLKGAFGRVTGADPAQPAAAAPDGRPLDTWMRRAPLELTSDIPPDDLMALTVESVPVAPEAAREGLSQGVTTFAGPDRPGVAVVVASVTTRSQGRSEHAWLLEVPDRAGEPELLFDIPGPRPRLVAGASSVDGEPGHGCYLYVCVEVGLRPPPASLEALPITLGDTPRLELDGSAIVGWVGTLERVDAAGDPVRAVAVLEDGPQAAVDLVGLEPTAAGEWLLELRADYDRERGWQWFLYRLVAE